MKRRGFFGFAAGAAVAGPGMAKEAISHVASGLEGMHLGIGRNVMSAGAQQAGGYASNAIASGMDATFDPVQHGIEGLAKLAGFNAARFKRGLHVGYLDPDILSYRSIALHAKIDMQRARMAEAAIAERRSYFQSMVDGLWGKDAEDWLP